VLGSRGDAYSTMQPFQTVTRRSSLSRVSGDDKQIDQGRWVPTRAWTATASLRILRTYTLGYEPADQQADSMCVAQLRCSALPTAMFRSHESPASKPCVLDSLEDEQPS